MAGGNVRKYKKRNLKRRWNRRRTQGGRMPVAYIRRGVFRQYNDVDPFPPSQVVKFTYTQTVPLTSGTGGIYGTEQAYRLNSLYDPDLTGVGHQPYGHDQMALIYRQYKVVGVNIKINWTAPDAQGMLCAACITNPNDTYSTSGKGADDLAEKPMCHVKSISNSGSQKMEWRQYMPMSELVGVTKSQFRNSTGTPYCALFGTNPSDMPLLRLNVANLYGNAGQKVYARTTITYYTQVFERLVQVQS